VQITAVKNYKQKNSATSGKLINCGSNYRSDSSTQSSLKQEEERNDHLHYVASKVAAATELRHLWCFRKRNSIHTNKHVSLPKGIALVKVIYGHSTESRLRTVHEHTHTHTLAVSRTHVQLW